MVCIQSKLSKSEDGDLNAVATNLLEFKSQMVVHGSKDRAFPEFLQMTTDGDTFNIHFRAKRSLLDYFQSKDASCKLAGLYLLRSIIPGMVRHWKRSRRITRNPLLSLIFKRDNDRLDAAGVCFLQCDLVSLKKKFDNAYNNPYYPRPKDIYIFNVRCGSVAEDDKTISCNLTAYLLFLLHNELDVTYDPDLSPDIYIYDGDVYFDKLIARSRLWAKSGIVNNASIMIMRSIVPMIQTGTLTVEFFELATRPPALVENHTSQFG